MASGAVMRQLAARGPLTPSEIETIWQNYGRNELPAAEIAVTLKRLVEWQHTPQGWMLIASAEACLLRAVATKPVELKKLPKQARMWFREHHQRLAKQVVENPVGTIRRPTATAKPVSGPASITGDGAIAAQMLSERKAFLLGWNMIVWGPYTSKAPGAVVERWHKLLARSKVSKKGARPVGKRRG